MATKNYLLNLLIGMFLAIPPALGNYAFKFIDWLAKSAHPSFSNTVSVLKIGVLLFGYYLIVVSLLQATQLTKEQ